MKSITILRGFRAKEQRFVPGGEAALLEAKPTEEELNGWKAAGFIDFDAEGEAAQAAEAQADVAYIISELENEADEDETPRMVLDRLIQEQNDNGDAAHALNRTNERLEAIVGTLSSRVGVERRSEESTLDTLERYTAQVIEPTTALGSRAQGASLGEGEIVQQGENTPRAGGNQQSGTSQQPTGTPVSVQDLAPIVTVKTAIALIEAGFDTREKIRAATNEELDAIEGLGTKLIEKLRDFVK